MKTQNKTTPQVVSIGIVSVKKSAIISIRLRGMRPLFMPESFKSVLRKNGYDTTIHFSSGQTAGVPNGEFDILTNPVRDDAAMLAPHMFRSAFRHNQ